VPAGSPVSITVGAAIAGLATGDYRDVIHIDSTAGSADVPVTLLVAGASTINLVPAGTLYSARQGQGLSNGTRSFQILTTGSNPVSWTASLIGGSGWLTLNTLSGTSSPDNPGVVSYTVDPSQLANADYYARIHIDAPSATNGPVDFLVVSDVAPATAPAVPDPSPAGLLFVSSPGSQVPPAQTILVNTSSIAPLNFSAAANTNSGGTWLSVSPSNGVASSGVPRSQTILQASGQ
jgi:Viral BACON domain